MRSSIRIKAAKTGRNSDVRIVEGGVVGDDRGVECDGRKKSQKVTINRTKRGVHGSFLLADGILRFAPAGDGIAPGRDATFPCGLPVLAGFYRAFSGAVTPWQEVRQRVLQRTSVGKAMKKRSVPLQPKQRLLLLTKDLHILLPSINPSDPFNLQP